MGTFFSEQQAVLAVGVRWLLNAAIWLVGRDAGFSSQALHHLAPLKTSVLRAFMTQSFSLDFAGKNFSSLIMTPSLLWLMAS